MCQLLNFTPFKNKIQIARNIMFPKLMLKWNLIILDRINCSDEESMSLNQVLLDFMDSIVRRLLGLKVKLVFDWATMDWEISFSFSFFVFIIAVYKFWTISYDSLDNQKFIVPILALCESIRLYVCSPQKKR